MPHCLPSTQPAPGRSPALWHAGGWRRTAGWGLLLAGLLAPSLGAEPPRHQYEVKAALLHSFTKFVQWPEACLQDAPYPFVIGILGKDPFGTRIDLVLDGKTAQGRPILIRRVDSIEAVGSCHIVFFGAMEPEREQRALKRLGDLPVLTIGESDTFVERGGAIQFIRVQNRVHFRINLQATGDAGLRIDPNLLKVASEILQAPHSNKHSE